MNELELIIDFHTDGNRQGPGSTEDTLRALRLIEEDWSKQDPPLNIADIGCGTGSHTLVLAQQLPDTKFTAVDLFPEFLNKLYSEAEQQGLSHRIQTLEASMDSLPFSEEQFDIIWSEGAIYNMGFAAGAQAWRPFLKTGGYLAVSEISWLTDERPAELEAFWTGEYPEIDTAHGKLKVLEECGYQPVGHFFLPPSSWIKNYYEPMLERSEAFLARHNHSELAQKVLQDNLDEFELFQKNQAYYSYGFYVARKV